MEQRKIAIIPLRAGSKGIIKKNQKKILGRPLFTWVLGEAIQSNLDHIYLFTDDHEIKAYVEKEYQWTSKVSVVERSEESANDTASTEFAMNELAEMINFKFAQFYLLQATSPLTTSSDINNAITLLNNVQVDSVLSVVKTHRFIWNNKGESLNYNYLNRPRRQDFEGLLIENGAIYGCKKETFLKTNNRLGDKIEVLEMSEDTLIEIDEPGDLVIIEQLLKNRLQSKNKFHQNIKYVVFDVDGVFTNGTVFYTKDGEFSKNFSFIDGMGFELLRENGIDPIIMTSEQSSLVQKRMEKLNILHVYLGVKDKYTRLSILLNELGSTRSEVAYLGDDINDLSNMLSVGWSACPINAVDIVKQNSDIQLHHSGGNGAIREFIEFLIKYNKRS
ncbi:acylneuraminate cytidylyltransferase [Plebeiibacterium sediminum]|uniref:N-acylneuraminate cytidylyltransferase n=1 Tax=Plebeiibacterium sediminum TaxID=2992112 RepID=A0AAE3SDG1_9BACT|nr:acylneuraminate cytidylyltransferase [Plebeiobacterium sediminum]MCW3785160.1 acylneuraminate cytidylyltransferase [Plebeiobacterium sediminum]